MARRWLANASPLILFGKVDHAALLVELCDELTIPETVVREVSVRPEGKRAIDELASTPGVRLAGDRPVPESIARWDLGPGESQVLTTTASTQDARSVLDDRAARRCAASLDLPVIGTVGVVLRAKHLGAIAAARPLLDRLGAEGLYISRELVEQALHHVGE